MKRILAIIGSPLTIKSNTKAMILDFLNSLKKYYDEFESEIIMVGEKNINFCRGCWACTKTGNCIIKDDMLEIKEKILKADFLIFGTPVYVQTVSAQTKVIFDRIFVWMHIQKLIGKPFITGITTAASGLKRTEKQLKDMSIYLGAIPVGHLRGKAFRPGEFPDREKVKSKNDKIAKKIAKYLNGKRFPKPTLGNKWIFLGMKYKAKYCINLLPYEYNYWKEKGLFNKNYNQALKLIRNRKTVIQNL